MEAITFAHMPRRHLSQRSIFVWLGGGIVSVLLCAIALMAWKKPRETARLALMPRSFRKAQSLDRVGPARARCGEKIEHMCRTAGVGYPVRALFLRAFKEEREAEAWGRADDGVFHRIATWRVLGASGHAGPKRREGDRQVPEGCYRVAVFNPKSNFHLSLGLDYPNESDRVRSDAQNPGSDIYIHGGTESIGCLALGDVAIEELYLLAQDAVEKPVSVHIFPARMAGFAWEDLRAKHPEHADFWSELKPIYEAFERTRRIPDVRVDPEGIYRLR